jgi:hypothetical protein
MHKNGRQFGTDVLHPFPKSVHDKVNGDATAMAAAMKFNPDTVPSFSACHPSNESRALARADRFGQPKPDWDLHDEESRMQEITIAHQRLLNQVALECLDNVGAFQQSSQGTVQRRERKVCAIELTIGEANFAAFYCVRLLQLFISLPPNQASTK